MELLAVLTPDVVVVLAPLEARAEALDDLAPAAGGLIAEIAPGKIAKVTSERLVKSALIGRATRRWWSGSRPPCLRASRGYSM